jgi:hypothetical protein
MNIASCAMTVRTATLAATSCSDSLWNRFQRHKVCYKFFTLSFMTTPAFDHQFYSTVLWLNFLI